MDIGSRLHKMPHHMVDVEYKIRRRTDIIDGVSLLEIRFNLSEDPSDVEQHCTSIQEIIQAVQATEQESADALKIGATKAKEKTHDNI